MSAILPGSSGAARRLPSVAELGTKYSPILRAHGFFTSAELRFMDVSRYAADDDALRAALGVTGKNFINETRKRIAEKVRTVVPEFRGVDDRIVIDRTTDILDTDPAARPGGVVQRSTAYYPNPDAQAKDRNSPRRR